MIHSERGVTIRCHLRVAIDDDRDRLKDSPDLRGKALFGAEACRHGY